MSNHQLPKSLHDAMERNTLIPFVGAGISMGVRDNQGGALFRSWKNLLLSAVELLKEENKPKEAKFIESSIDVAESSEDYLNIADKTAQYLATKWSDFLNDNFDKNFDEVDSNTLKIAKEIWNINNFLITTNYDNVMNWVSDDKNLVTWDKKAISGQVTSLKQHPTKKILWHLHGRIDNLDDIVLTSKSYEDTYKEDSPEIKVFQTHLLTKSFIFLGFSLDDEYLRMQLEYLKKLFGNNNSKHYIVLKEGDKRDFKDLGDIQCLYVKDFNEDYLRLLQEISSVKVDKTELKDTVSLSPVNKVVDIDKSVISKKICIYTASPLNSNYNYNFGVISNPFKKFDVKIYHKTLNEDEISEHYDFDFCFIFTKTNNDKIIIEDEYFMQKSITLTELSEMIGTEKTKLFLDKNIENSDFDIKVTDTNTLIKRTLMSLLHKELNFQNGQSQTFKLDTDLPELIDKKNLINFIGRNTDIEHLVKKILTIKNENKILTIKGAGGIGKTTLISKVAVEFSKRGLFDDGIKFIQCEFIKDYEEFENKISFAFDMSNAINFKMQLKEQITDDEKRLIILDNVETILHIEDTNKIKEFIKFISDFATIVITSREKFNEEFEDVYEVKNLSTDEAEELFIKLYSIDKYDKKFLRNDILENMLNNNPLAIKLVTKNLPKNKDLTTLKEELDKSFFDITVSDIEKMFENESDTNIERTKSLFGSINYSYSRLSIKEKLALELLSLFPDGMHIDNFKIFYNKKEDNDNKKTIKKKIENFSDRDLKSLEDKSLIINNNQVINLQSIIGRFSDYKFKNKREDEKIEYYIKAYGYNAFILTLIEGKERGQSSSAHIFDNNKNNFLKCLDYMQYLDLDEPNFSFIDDLDNHFALSSSPNEKIFEKLNRLKSIVVDDKLKKGFFEANILALEYFYGNFNDAYNEIKAKYPLNDIIKNYNLYNKIEKWYIGMILNIYGMEGNQFQEVKVSLSDNRHDLSTFNLGEYSILEKYLDKQSSFRNRFTQFELALNTKRLDIKKLRKYIDSIYKTEFIQKVQTTYILLKVDKGQVSIRDIKKLIITNPFTDGLKTLMLAVKNDKNSSKKMYEEAIEKLYHIRYYHVEAILLYCQYLKDIDDEDYRLWFEKGIELSKKHFYRYLQHGFICLDSGIYTDYDENDYPLPEKLDYAGVIKEYNL